MSCDCTKISVDDKSFYQRVGKWLSKRCPHCNNILEKFDLKEKPILKCFCCKGILE